MPELEQFFEEQLVLARIRMIDLAIILDLPAEEGIARARDRALEHREPIDRFEKMDLLFHERVRAGYKYCVGKYTTTVDIIDASGDEEGVWQTIRRHIEEYLAR